MDDFFEKIIKYKRSGLTDQMFKLIGMHAFVNIVSFWSMTLFLIIIHIIESNNDSSLTFGEFVEVIHLLIHNKPCFISPPNKNNTNLFFTGDRDVQLL